MAGYGDDTKFNAWLAANGYALPSGLTAPVLRQRGSVYIDGLYGPQFSGTPTGGFTQERAFPRTGATAYGAAVPTDAIPVAVEHASYFAAYHEALNPGALSVAVTAAALVKRKKVGSIEIEYREGSGDSVTNATPLLSAV